MAMKLKEQYLAPFVSPEELEGMAPMVAAAAQEVEEGTGRGNDFLGWVHLPTRHDREEVRRIKAAAEKIRRDSEVLVVIGIGGSYLGARSAIERMKGIKCGFKSTSCPDQLAIALTEALGQA